MKKTCILEMSVRDLSVFLIFLKNCIKILRFYFILFNTNWYTKKKKNYVSEILR